MSWRHATSRRVCGGAVLACLAALASLPASAQISAAGALGGAEGMNTLNSGGAGPGGAGNLALDRARNLNQGGMPGTPGTPGTPGGFGSINAEDFQSAAQEVVQFVKFLFPLKVITGTRVRDAITGELLDDAREKFVRDEDRENYFDDGTHGDITADDGQYTRVDERSDVIGQSHQRVKEQLVKALSVAENYDPLEFYGFTIMSTDRLESEPRNRVWKMRADPDGRPGMVMVEEPTDTPVVVPKYRDWQHKKDIDVIRSGWMKDFLADFRKNPDNMASEFHPVYVPLPPPVPGIKPPVEAAWAPFGQQAGAAGGDQVNQHFIDTLGGRKTKGAAGTPQGAASSSYF